MFSKLSATIVAVVFLLLIAAVMLYRFHPRPPMIYRMELEHKSSIGAGKESAHSITVEEGSNAVRFVPIVTFSHLHPEDWKDIMGGGGNNIRSNVC